jgi:glutamine synthetase
VTWGYYDRRALVRIPIVPLDGRGRATSPPTIEFRLPDGSAHPHLLLAAVAQSVVAGHDMVDVDAMLERAAVTAGQPAAGRRVPLTFAEIADALAQSRAMLEAGGVFAPTLLDRAISLLRG